MADESSRPPSAETQAPHPVPKVTRDNLDLKAVARVSSQARLVDLRLHDCSAELNTDPQDLSADWRDRIFNGYDSSFEGLDEDKRIVKVRCAFICVYMEGVDLRKDRLPPYEPDNPPTFAIDAAFDLAYSLKPETEFDEDDLAHFAFANGTHNAWPYWREFVQNFTQRMGIDPVVVGPFKLPSPHDPPSEQGEPESEPDRD